VLIDSAPFLFCCEVVVVSSSRGLVSELDCYRGLRCAVCDWCVVGIWCVGLCRMVRWSKKCSLMN